MHKRTRVEPKSLGLEFEASVDGRSDLVIAQGFYRYLSEEQGIQPMPGGCLIWLQSSGRDLTRIGDQYLHDGKPIQLDDDTAHLLRAYHDYFASDLHRCNAWYSKSKAWLKQINRQFSALAGIF